MTTNGRNEEQPASLSLSQVYRLIELEQIEMDRRVAERRGPVADSSNVICFRARLAESVEIEPEHQPLRRSHG
jgi:hypothetical protein